MTNRRASKCYKTHVCVQDLKADSIYTEGESGYGQLSDGLKAPEIVIDPPSSTLQDSDKEEDKKEPVEKKPDQGTMPFILYTVLTLPFMFICCVCFGIIETLLRLIKYNVVHPKVT